MVRYTALAHAHFVRFASDGSSFHPFVMCGEAARFPATSGSGFVALGTAVPSGVQRPHAACQNLDLSL
ncbi:MAG: hypothetical protein LBQ54_01150 [Planctomycetaceae bacterium]|nr:hypothetical protein [Planctomycetaceae bacterium]